MMNISQQKIKELLSSWQTIGIKDRDKIIYDALFEPKIIGIKFDKDTGEEYDVYESLSPMFSDNIKDNEATDMLVTKLLELGYDLKIDNLPRSTLSIIRCGDLSIQNMPAHKGIAYFAYVLAVSDGE